MITNEKNVHPLIVDFIKNQRYAPKKDTIGVTTLIGPPLVRQLRYKFWEYLDSDVSESLWALFGTMFHSQMEKCKIPGWTYELRMEKQIHPKFPKLVGYSDAYNYLTKELIDFKVTSVWTIIYGLKDGKSEWEQQLNVYRYLLNGMGIDVNSSNVLAILRDWQASKAEKEKDYPESPFFTYPIKLWTPKEAESFINERVQAHSKAAKECTDEEKWLKPTTYAAKKKANKTASGGKVTENLTEAEQFIAKQEKPDLWEIEVRKGEASKCIKYCAVREFCPYSPCFNKEKYSSTVKEK